MSLCLWKPIHYYLHFDSFPTVHDNMDIDELHEFLYALFHYFPYEIIRQSIQKIFTIHCKRGLLITLEECENNLFVLKKKSVFTEQDMTAMVSILGMNTLRKWCPNFIFTFYHKSFENKFSTEVMEFVDGVTFFKFFHNLFFLNSKEKLQENWLIFLSIFLQILFALEIAQEQLFFTHYDLHLWNIIIEMQSNKKEFCYTIHNGNYYFTNITYIPKIIDFEFSIIKPMQHDTKNNFIGNLYESTIPFGYFGSYLPGVDMLRFLFCIRNMSKMKSFLGRRIDKFLDKIFLDFFKMSKNFVSSCLKTRSKTFFNLTDTSYVYETPYELILFLFQNYSFHRVSTTIQLNDNHIKYCPNGKIVPPPATAPISVMEKFLQKYKKQEDINEFRKKKIIESLTQLIIQKKKMHF